MFEHEDGMSRLCDEKLMQTELDRGKLANWAYRFHMDMLANRELEFPDTQLSTIFNESTWILRSCLVSFK